MDAVLLPLLATLFAAASASNWCGNGAAPVQTIPCPNGKCDCAAPQCPASTRQVCGQSAVYCCPAALGMAGGLGMGMGGFGGGFGMGGLGMGMGMGGLGMLGLGMPGTMCGGSMLGALGLGGGLGCQGGSMCQPPIFQGLAQRMMMQRQLQMLMMQQQMRAMMQPRLGMSIRVCTCPPGMYSMQGMCRPFGGGMVGIGGQCGGMGGLSALMGMGMGGGLGSCVPNAMCMGGVCQCQQGFLPTGQYCSPLAGMVQPLQPLITSQSKKSING